MGLGNSLRKMDGFIIVNKRGSNGTHRVLVVVRHIVCIEEFRNGCLIMLSDDKEYRLEVTESLDDIVTLLKLVL